MEKLRALTAYLIERRLVQPEQLDSWAEQVTLPLYWKPTELGLHMGDMRYRAVIVMERFTAHPGRLMALVGSWLEAHDPAQLQLIIGLGISAWLSQPAFSIHHLNNPWDWDRQDRVVPRRQVKSAAGIDRFHRNHPLRLTVGKGADLSGFQFVDVAVDRR